MYDTILIPTDGSETAEAGLDEALEIAKLTEGTVHGLFVFDIGEYNTVPASDLVTTETELTERKEQAMAVVESRAEDMSVPVETTTVRGAPHQAILAYVDEHDIDLIVMGTHGRTGFDHFLRGSVTEKVLHRATVPVLVLRPMN